MPSPNPMHIYIFQSNFGPIRKRQSEYAALAQAVASSNGSSLVGNRMFWGGDYMVHRRAGYFTSVKAFSTRIANSECVNSENLLV
jgi:chondroitin AC lyase